MTRARLALAALALSTFTYVTTETLPIGLLPQIADGLQARASSVGLLVTAYGLIVVVATLPLTRLTRRWPRKRLLGVLLGIFVVATALSAAAPGYATLLAARVVTALSQAVFWAIVSPAAAALFPPAARGRAVSTLYVGSSAATLVGVPAGTWLGQVSSWRVPFVVLCVLGVLVMVALQAILPDVAPGASGTDRGTAPDAGRYRVLVVTVILAVTAAFTAYTYVNPFLTQVSGLAESAVGPALVLRGVAGMAGVFVAGWFVSRFGWLTMLTAIGLQAVALGVLYAFGTITVLAVVVSAVTSFALSGMVTALGARVLEVAPGDTDTANAGTSTAFNVGITAGALIGAALIDGPGVRSTVLVGALIGVLGFAVVAAEPLLAGLQPRIKRSHSSNLDNAEGRSGRAGGPPEDEPDVVDPESSART
ncbi:MFS transporter [Actinoplanes sp. NPDC051343]|uniref:MFS transporter n=1 Tax=Actinoplanes sp. NPDC051343 TaxID=3363906 RepID=UPI00379BBF11